MLVFDLRSAAGGRAVQLSVFLYSPQQCSQIARQTMDTVSVLNVNKANLTAQLLSQNNKLSCTSVPVSRSLITYTKNFCMLCIVYTTVY